MTLGSFLTSTQCVVRNRDKNATSFLIFADRDLFVRDLDFERFRKFSCIIKLISGFLTQRPRQVITSIYQES